MIRTPLRFRRSRLAIRQGSLSRRFRPASLWAIMMGVAFSAHAAPDRNAQLALLTVAPTGRVVVKFKPDAGLVVRGGGLAIRPDAPIPNLAAGTAGRVEALVARLAPSARLTRRFSLPLERLAAIRAAAAARGGEAPPDLDAWGQLDLVSRRGDPVALRAIVKALLADPAVETAFLEPVAVPAALGFDALAGDKARATISASPLAVAALADTTPDFSALQGYLGPAPLGVDALALAAEPGADGAGLTAVDIEGAWLWTHEDLAPPSVTLGEPVTTQSWRDHGTAVLGALRGQDNGLGVRGIAPGLAIGGASIAELSVADAIAGAAAALEPGDVILIEVHAPGPRTSGAGQYGYLPMEFWLDNFEAIRLATAAGIIVCEAAGNGQQNLDDPFYEGLFDREVRDSGAIMCGASDGSTLWPAWFTNFGRRVDLHAWGLDVVTTGYGALQGDPLPEERWYTDQFNGTSSATPIVAGAVAVLQGLFRQRHGFPLAARLARDLLRETGTPQLVGPDAKLIGPRPDLAAAWLAAQGGAGRVTGTVADAVTGAPVPGVEVRVAETDAFDLTDAAGEYAFPLLAGQYTLGFASFLHETREAPVSVAPGAAARLDVTLPRRSTVALGGRVYDALGRSLPGARVTPLGVPIAAVACDAAGRFDIPTVPSGLSYQLLVGGAPGFGARLRAVTVPAGLAGEVDVFTTLPAARCDFEADDAGFVAQTPLWRWGEPARDVGPAGGFSGDRCWGVGMEADYPDSQRANLTSPAYDFADAPALFLSLHYWCDTEAGFDGVKLQATRDSLWSNVSPLSVYSHQTIAGLVWRPGWSGQSDGWQSAVFDLSSFRSPTFRFRLAFGSDYSVTGAGFWVDDIAFDFGAESDNQGKPPPPPARVLTVWPNPSNAGATIAWRDVAAGPLLVTVHDLRGRRVRGLVGADDVPPAGRAFWDGRDDRGATVASGVYIVRLRDASGATFTRRLALTR